jgi:prolyl-tRNA editing enzyme YbaK/EbsC (Cys-tRNA(Pro) deacylase)
MNKIQSFIETNRVQCKLLKKPSTQETLKAHEALRLRGYLIGPDQMIKALVCIPVSNGKYLVENALLALVSGMDRLSIVKLQKVTGHEKIVIADQKTAEKLSGYPRGGTPPIAHDAKLVVVMDEDLAKRPMLYGGGGSTEYVMEIAPPEISRVLNEIQKTQCIIAPIHE